MYYCPNCSNIFDITKDLTQKQSGGKIDKEESEESDVSVSTETITTSEGGSLSFDKLIEKILNNKDIKESDVDDIKLHKLNKSSSYKKLSKDDKTKVLNMIEDNKSKSKKSVVKSVQQKDKSHSIFFICKNCSYYKKIKPKTLIFSKVSESISQSYNIDNQSNKIHSKILPLTRKYNCPNEKCVTHEKPSLKEAVMYKDTNSYAIKYICKSCYTEWM